MLKKNQWVQCAANDCRGEEVLTVKEIVVGEGLRIVR